MFGFNTGVVYAIALTLVSVFASDLTVSYLVEDAVDENFIAETKLPEDNQVAKVRSVIAERNKLLGSL